MIDELAAGFPAGVEAWLPPAALPVQCQQTEALAQIGGGLFVMGRHPMLEHRFAEPQEFLGRRGTGSILQTGFAQPLLNLDQ
jgi:hypothetical protein